jgi:quercetin dioxygenase-like cupin family protein
MPGEIVTLLDGEVWKRTLPLITGKPGPDAPLLKRLLLGQGELAQFWDGEEPIQYMAFMELRAGTVRGNHFHRLKREFVYVISGQAVLIVEHPKTKQRQTTELRTGDLAGIAPEVAHAYQAVSSGQAIEFSPSKFNAQDTFACPLV